jgi:hypothetical protein
MFCAHSTPPVERQEGVVRTVGEDMLFPLPAQEDAPLCPHGVLPLWPVLSGLLIFQEKLEIWLFI